jgi:hypothetical protein
MNNTFLKPGQIFRVVGNDEPLKPEFLLRHMYESPMYSESGGWDTTFKKEGWLGTAWHRVDEEIPAWVGSTINELNLNPVGIKYFYEVIELI